MNDDNVNSEYNAKDNAIQFSRLVMNCIPGNTLDIILDKISSEILPMLDNQDKIDVLKCPYDIQNRIRGALNQLENEWRLENE